MNYLKYTILFFTISVLFIFKSPAQISETKFLKNWELKGYAQDAFKKGDAFSALIYQQEYIKRKPSDIEQLYFLAELYKKVRDYANAQAVFSKVYNENPEKYSKALFNSALMNKNLGKYYVAYNELTLYEKRIKKEKADKTQLQTEINGCFIAISYKDTGNLLKVYHLDTSVNKPHIEFAPMILDDTTLVYGSSELKKINYFPINNDSALSFRKFFISKRKNDSVWVKTRLQEMPFVNYNDMHTGNGVFSLSKNRFYSTRCKNNSNFKMVCSLYFSENKNGFWTEPVRLDNTINDPDYISTQPAVGTCYIDGLEVIYFSSDRPGGIGGFDIWYTIYNPQTNTYSKALNAGLFINTPGDEITPFFDMESHSLYFSSDGWPNIGGKDVFRSFGDLMTWSQPENLGYPINSSCDDQFYTKEKEHKFGFFTSNRKGSISLKHEHCCDDIYYFKQLKSEDIYVSGKLVMNDISNEIKKTNITDLSDIKKIQRRGVVSLYMVDEKSEPIFIAKDSTNYLGEFSFNVIRNKEYKVVIEDDRAIDNSFLFSTVNEQNLNIKFDSIPVKVIPDQPIIIDNIYYEFDRYDLTDESKKYLDTTLLIFFQKYQNLEIEIRSHTDNIGTDDYNFVLSQKRSESVIQYLEEKGVDKNRLTAMGFGAKLPIAKNTNDDGSDNPEGRKKNRRTEFKITRKNGDVVLIR